MNKLKLTTTVFSLALVSLTSCDPAKLIIVKNKSDRPACFYLAFKGSRMVGEGYEKEFETLKIELGTTKPDNRTAIPFGFGGWPRREVERFVDEQVKSIEIVGKETNVSMTDKQEMTEYLLARRRGLFNQFITIRID